jgi:hypothetical protein
VIAASLQPVPSLRQGDMSADLRGFEPRIRFSAQRVARNGA